MNNSKQQDPFDRRDKKALRSVHVPLGVMEDYVRGKLTAQEGNVVLDHISDCRQCAVMKDDLCAFWRDAAETSSQASPTEEDAGSVERVLERLQQAFAENPPVQEAAGSVAFTQGNAVVAGELVERAKRLLRRATEFFRQEIRFFSTGLSPLDMVPAAVRTGRDSLLTAKCPANLAYTLEVADAILVNIWFFSDGIVMRHDFEAEFSFLLMHKDTLIPGIPHPGAAKFIYFALPIAQEVGYELRGCVLAADKMALLHLSTAGN